MDLSQPLKPEHYQTVRDLVLSGQIEADRLVLLLAENQDFARWYDEAMQGKR